MNDLLTLTEEHKPRFVFSSSSESVFSYIQIEACLYKQLKDSNYIFKVICTEYVIHVELYIYHRLSCSY